MHMEQNGAYNICIEIFFAEIITCTCPTKQQEQERNAVYDWRQESEDRRHGTGDRRRRFSVVFGNVRTRHGSTKRNGKKTSSCVVLLCEFWGLDLLLLLLLVWQVASGVRPEDTRWSRLQKTKQGNKRS